MPATVEFQDERIAFPLDDASLIGEWHGPEGRRGPAIGDEVRGLLEVPLGFPPLRQALVPGDRVALVLDPEVPEARAILAAVCDVLIGAGVDREGLAVVLASRPSRGEDDLAPPGLRVVVHDPDDRESMAYLATTEGGRRVYLNRELIDADFVLPVGRLGHDRMLGPRGPGGVLYPGMSDRETQVAFRAAAGERRAIERNVLETSEVGWLMGNLFQIGVLEGASGVAAVIAGMADAVRDEGRKRWASTWTFRADRRADLVVAGVGEPGRPAGWDEVAAALGAATGLARRGGKIVILSRAQGSPGPAIQTLMGLDDPHSAIAGLRGAEGEPDYPAALAIARALAWADLYVLSLLGDDLAEDLGFIPLGRPEEALRLAAASPSVVLLSHAERTSTATAEDEDS